MTSRLSSCMLFKLHGLCIEPFPQIKNKIQSEYEPFLKKNSHFYGKLSLVKSIKQMFTCEFLVLHSLKPHVTLNSFKTLVKFQKT